MTLLELAEHVTALRADLAEAERELDRADALGDAGAVARVRHSVEPRLLDLRRAIADAERLRATMTEGDPWQVFVDGFAHCAELGR